MAFLPPGHLPKNNRKGHVSVPPSLHFSLLDEALELQELPGEWFAALQSLDLQTIQFATFHDELTGRRFQFDMTVFPTGTLIMIVGTTPKPPCGAARALSRIIHRTPGASALFISGRPESDASCVFVSSNTGPDGVSLAFQAPSATGVVSFLAQGGGVPR